MGARAGKQIVSPKSPRPAHVVAVASYGAASGAGGTIMSTRVWRTRVF